MNHSRNTTTADIKAAYNISANCKSAIIIRAALTAVLLALVVAMVPMMSVAAISAQGTADVFSESDRKTQEAPPYTSVGESVKCRSGVLVDPIGDPGAAPPDIRAEGAALYSLDISRQVFGLNENDRLDPYSTTKLLTCWLALENLDPGQIVTVSGRAAQVYENGTTIWLKEGENIRVIDLVYGAMLESGNDAAYALGEVVAGSEKEFAELMNRTAESWGCSDTHFVNANGWKNKDHYTTARDMMIIAAKCLENEELRNISVTPKYTAPATNMTGAREMKNYTLKAAGNAEGLTGGKSGTWDDDDCGIVASFSREGLEGVLVVLGDTDKGRPKDVRKLMEFSHEVTPGYAVPAYEAVVETAWVKHGSRTRIELTSDGVTYAYPASNKAHDITTEVRYDKLEAPIAKGEAVGDLLIYADDRLIGEHKLVAAETVETGWLPSYIYISNRMSIAILCAAAVLAAAFFLVRSRNQEKRAARKRLREKYRTKH